MPVACRRLVTVAALLVTAAATVRPAALGQAPAPAPDHHADNTPGRFDYFVLDMPWGPVFCSSIKDVSPTCRPQPGFVVHGLWPQNNNDTWPEFCAKMPGPGQPATNLDITPDLALLQHEWNKHGTCSGLGPEAFFVAEHAAFAQVVQPTALLTATTTRTFTPEFVLNMFQQVNPGFPPGSFSLSCRDGHVTAIEACFSKSLQPMRCQGLTSCRGQAVSFDPLP